MLADLWYPVGQEFVGSPIIGDDTSFVVSVIITGSRIAAVEIICKRGPDFVSEKRMAISNSRILNLPQRGCVIPPCLVAIQASVLDLCFRLVICTFQRRHDFFADCIFGRALCSIS